MTVSNAIGYDSLLVREFAHELDQRMAGRLVNDARFNAAAAEFTLDAGPGAALFWRLDPQRGGLGTGRAGRGGTALRVPAGARIARVVAPADERIVIFDFDAPPTGDAPGGVVRIVVELVTSRWNAIALREGGVVAAVLRDLRGARAPRPGQPWVAPAPLARAGADAPLDHATWTRLLGAVPPAERERALLRGVAYTSPINARSIIGDGADLDAAYERYRAVVLAPEPRPCLLRGVQPYPIPLPSVPAEPFDSLVAAFEAAARNAGATEAPSPRKSELRRLRALDAVRHALARVQRKHDRLAAELAGARPDAERLRHQADLLLAQIHRVRRGERQIELDDWSGGQVTIELDPAITPAENASRLYAAARKRERAAGTLPALIDRAAAEAERLAALADRIDAGDATAVREAEARFRLAGTRPAVRAAPPLPYRRYRTSGGLEVRVGRGPRANDELTFHHSAPDDIWLHARDAGGAHVVLRWARREGNPPLRDIVEAATLAALHSKARTSAAVPVDWTRRKYVRKPRKAPPGLVLVDRARTLFVEPDPSVERRLRDGDEI